VDGAFQLSFVDLGGVVELFLDFEDVHQYHRLLFFFHVLCIGDELLKDFLNF
jgi:hypothetical protein